MNIKKVSFCFEKTGAVEGLTFWRAVYNFVFLLGMLQNALGTEHVSVLCAIKLDFLCGVLRTVLNLAFCHLRCRHCGVRGRCHGKSRKNLVVDGQVIGSYIMVAFVIWTLDHTVLGELANTFRTEGVTARK